MDKRELIKNTEHELKDLIYSLSEWINIEKYFKELEEIVYCPVEDILEEQLSEVLVKLDKLKMELLGYNKFVLADDSLDTNLWRIDKEDIDKEMVMICVKQMLQIIKKIDEDNIGLDKAEELIKHFYFIAYNLMQKELLFSNKSLIYDYAIKNKNIKQKFIEYIKEDYEFITQLLSEKKNENVNCQLLINYMYNIEFNGNEIFDKKVIRMLAKINSSNKEFVDKINDQFSTIYKNLNKIINDITIVETQKRNNFDSIFRLNDSIKERKEELKKRGLSIMLSLSILGCSYLGVSKVSKFISTDKCYSGTVTTYSSVDNEPKKEDMLFDISDDIDSNIKLNVYSKVYNNGLFNIDKFRTMETYDVSDYTFESLDGYFDIDLTKLSYDIKETAYEEGTSTEKYYEVSKTEVDKSQVISNLKAGEYWFYVFVILAVIDLLLSAIPFYLNDSEYKFKKIYIGIFFNVYEMLFALVDTPIKSVKLDLDKNLDKIPEYDKSIQLSISEYEKIKTEFSKMYYKYKYILDDGYNQFININKLEEDTVRHLIRRKKK